MSEKTDEREAVLFYGYVQPDKDDARWNAAGRRFDEELGEQGPGDVNPVVMYQLADGRYYLAVEASQSIAYADEPVEFSPAWMVSSLIADWKAMLIDFASRYGIQLGIEVPGWCLAVSK